MLAMRQERRCKFSSSAERAKKKKKKRKNTAEGLHVFSLQFPSKTPLLASKKVEIGVFLGVFRRLRGPKGPNITPKVLLLWVVLGRFVLRNLDP